MIMFATAMGRILRWLDRHTEDAYGAYLHARWPDKYMSRKEQAKR